MENIRPQIAIVDGAKDREGAANGQGVGAVPGRRKRRPRHRLDRRRPLSREVLALTEAYVVALGGAATVTGAMRERVTTAAELRVIARDARARYLRGEQIPLNDLVRSENLAARAEAALGIGDGKPRNTRTLRQYLAEKRAGAV
jgi:hypothetical protein